MKERKTNVKLSPRAKVKAMIAEAKQNEALHGVYGICCKKLAKDLDVTTPTVSNFRKAFNAEVVKTGKGRVIQLLSRTYTSGGGESLADLVDEFADLMDDESADELADSVVE